MKKELEKVLRGAAPLIIGLGTLLGNKIIELVDRIPETANIEEDKK